MSSAPLPNEQLFQICQYFKAEDLCRVSHVDNRFHTVATDTRLWKVLCAADFPGYFAHIKESTDWKKTYQEFYQRMRTFSHVEMGFEGRAMIPAATLVSYTLLLDITPPTLFCSERDKGVSLIELTSPPMRQVLPVPPVFLFAQFADNFLFCNHLKASSTHLFATIDSSSVILIWQRINVKIGEEIHLPEDDPVIHLECDANSLFALTAFGKLHQIDPLTANVTKTIQLTGVLDFSVQGNSLSCMLTSGAHAFFDLETESFFPSEHEQIISRFFINGFCFLQRKDGVIDVKKGSEMAYPIQLSPGKPLTYIKAKGSENDGMSVFGLVDGGIYVTVTGTSHLIRKFQSSAPLEFLGTMNPIEEIWATFRQTTQNVAKVFFGRLKVLLRKSK